MKKKEIIVICVIAIFAISAFGIYRLHLQHDLLKSIQQIIGDIVGENTNEEIGDIVGENTNEEIGVITYNGEVYLEFDVNVDATYELDGDYGHMYIEVKDGRWRVTREECPNHICSSIGWVSVKDYFPIVCFPNDVIVTLKD